MNYTQLKQDLEEVLAERRENERDAYAVMERAKRRLDYATLETDMRTWDEGERDEYQTALTEYMEAYDQWTAAKAAL